METLKNKIANLAQTQSDLKNQRKTVNLVGERIISPSEAQWKVELNKEKLREMYIVYGLSKGLEYSQIETNPKIPFTQEALEKLMEKWKDSI